jgi:hypothetical protein
MAIAFAFFTKIAALSALMPFFVSWIASAASISVKLYARLSLLVAEPKSLVAYICMVRAKAMS